MKIAVTDLHSGGGAIRIVQESQLPPIPGKTLLEKRKYFRENLDYIRKLILLEPRGHDDLYGIVVVESDIPETVAGLILLHNAGYGSMCGHGSIALGRYLIDQGIVSSPVSPETEMTIQCPCGPVKVWVEYKDGKTGKARFQSVPSCIYNKDVTADIPGYGSVTADVCYGGAFFVLVKASCFGLDVDTCPMQDLVRAGDATTRAVSACVDIKHPDSPDLAIIMGTILTDDNDEFSEIPTSMVCVFADQQVERSPCGAGSSARVAQLYQRGLLQIGQSRTVRGPAGGFFTAKPIREVQDGDHGAVVVEVSGTAFYTGTSVLELEEGDEIGKGFILRR